MDPYCAQTPQTPCSDSRTQHSLARWPAGTNLSPCSRSEKNCQPSICVHRGLTRSRTMRCWHKRGAIQTTRACRGGPQLQPPAIPKPSASPALVCRFGSDTHSTQRYPRTMAGVSKLQTRNSQGSCFYTRHERFPPTTFQDRPSGTLGCSAGGTRQSHPTPPERPDSRFGELETRALAQYLYVRLAPTNPPSLLSLSLSKLSTSLCLCHVRTWGFVDLAGVAPRRASEAHEAGHGRGAVAGAFPFSSPSSVFLCFFFCLAAAELPLDARGRDHPGVRHGAHAHGC